MDSSFVGWRHPAAAAAEGGALLSPQKQRRRQSEFYLILLPSRSRLFVGPSLPPSRGQCLLLLLLFWRDQMDVCVCAHARFVPRKMVLSLSLSFPPPNNARVGRPRKRDEQWRECYITRVLRPGLRGRGEWPREGGVIDLLLLFRIYGVMCQVFVRLMNRFLILPFPTEAPCTLKSRWVAKSLLWVGWKKEEEEKTCCQEDHKNGKEGRKRIFRRKKRTGFRNFESFLKHHFDKFLRERKNVSGTKLYSQLQKGSPVSSRKYLLSPGARETLLALASSIFQVQIFWALGQEIYGMDGGLSCTTPHFFLISSPGMNPSLCFFYERSSQVEGVPFCKERLVLENSRAWLLAFPNFKSDHSGFFPWKYFSSLRKVLRDLSGELDGGKPTETLFLASLLRHRNVNASFARHFPRSPQKRDFANGEKSVWH